MIGEYVEKVMTRRTPKKARKGRAKERKKKMFKFRVSLVIVGSGTDLS